MPLEKYRHPVLFYVLATAIPWAFWFAAAYLSHITPTNQLLATAVGVLGVVGLLGPTIIAFWMIWPQADLRNDLARRMIGLKCQGQPNFPQCGNSNFPTRLRFVVE